MYCHTTVVYSEIETVRILILHRPVSGAIRTTRHTPFRSLARRPGRAPLKLTWTINGSGFSRNKRTARAVIF